MEGAPMSGWYTVFCKPRGEALAEANLANQGYRVYLPRLLSRRRRAGKWVDCVEPLFPRYMFLKLRDAAQSLSPVRSTLGVANLVRFGNEPAVVADALIQQLREREDPVAGMHAERKEFKPGDTVKFLEGPFSGLEAVFSRKSGEERVIVLLEILGKTNRLKIESDWLAPAA
jgi:transcriptional antiterminator RfaH